MGYGATPHRIRKEARGAAPNPRLFLEKKEGKEEKAENAVFGGGLKDFCGGALLLDSSI